MYVIEYFLQAGYVKAYIDSMIVDVDDHSDDKQIRSTADRIFELDWVKSINPMSVKTDTGRRVFSHFKVVCMTEVETEREVERRIEIISHIRNVQQAGYDIEIISEDKVPPSQHRWGGFRIKESQE